MKDGYTIAQVRLYADSLVWQRQKEQLTQAEAVRWGIAAAFNPKGGLLEKLGQLIYQSPGDEAEAEAANPELLTALFGLPVLE